MWCAAFFPQFQMCKNAHKGAFLRLSPSPSRVSIPKKLPKMVITARFVMRKYQQKKTAKMYFWRFFVLYYQHRNNHIQRRKSDMIKETENKLPRMRCYKCGVRPGVKGDIQMMANMGGGYLRPVYYCRPCQNKHRRGVR